MGDSRIKNRKYYIVNEDNTDELLEIPVQDSIIQGTTITNNKICTHNSQFMIDDCKLILVLDIDDNIFVLNNDAFSIDILVVIIHNVLKI